MKKKTNISISDWLRVSVLRLSRVHYVFAAIITLQILIYDAFKLVPPDAILDRWSTLGALLIVNTLVWFFAHNQGYQPRTYRLLIVLLLVTDIICAAISVYLQRGMDARVVMLFALPIVASSILLNPVAIFATAMLSAIAYVLAAVKYFVDFFNEGYKIELYGEVSFYCGFFFILAAVLSIIVRFRADQ